MGTQWERRGVGNNIRGCRRSDVDPDPFAAHE